MLAERRNTDLPMPPWFERHGMLMRLRPEQSDQNRVVIDNRSNAAVLQITRVKSLTPLWKAQWEIRMSADRALQGEVLMELTTLRGAFGFIDTIPRGSEWLALMHKATSAEEGKYIRYGDFLNISGPGTPWEGKSNISVELNNEMQSAIAVSLETP